MQKTNDVGIDVLLLLLLWLQVLVPLLSYW